MLTKDEVKKTGIFRALQLGDLLCSIPAIRAFKNAYPSAEITLIGLPWAKNFASRFNHYFSDFILFPGYPGLPEQKFCANDFEAFTHKIKDSSFDLILQMQGNGTIVNSMLKTLGSGYKIGFAPYADSITDKTRFLKYPDQGHEIDRHLALMNFIGIYSQDTSLEFPILLQDIREFKEMALPISKGRYICVHPGSRGKWRQWPPLYFAAIADYCFSLGFEIVLTGTNDELEIIKHVTALMKSPAIIAAGKTTLGSLGVLINESAAIICNCTGVSHVASALQVPAVVISMDGEPGRWAPKNGELHRCVDWTRNPDYNLVFKEVRSLLLML